MAKRIEWTDSRKQTLRRLLAEGLNYREAGERMGIRRDQAKSAAHAHGLRVSRAHRKWREWARHEYDTVERLLEEGLTYPQIAQQMGLGTNEVKGAAQRLGLMDPDRVGQHHRRDDWHAIDRIAIDCIEAQLMTIPQAHRHLGAMGYQIALSTLYRRVKSISTELRARAEKNSRRRKVVVGRRVMLARQARKRQQEEHAA